MNSLEQSRTTDQLLEKELQWIKGLFIFDSLVFLLSFMFRTTGSIMSIIQRETDDPNTTTDTYSDFINWNNSLATYLRILAIICLIVAFLKLRHFFEEKAQGAFLAIAILGGINIVLQLVASSLLTFADVIFDQGNILEYIQNVLYVSIGSEVVVLVLLAATTMVGLFAIFYLRKIEGMRSYFMVTPILFSAALITALVFLIIGLTDPNFPFFPQEIWDGITYSFLSTNILGIGVFIEYLITFTRIKPKEVAKV